MPQACARNLGLSTPWRGPLIHTDRENPGTETGAFRRAPRQGQPSQRPASGEEARPRH